MYHENFQKTIVLNFNKEKNKKIDGLDQAVVWERMLKFSAKSPQWNRL